jgi:ketosteroid isomerase-like protein
MQIKNIINERITNWYSNLCSLNIEGLVNLYSSNITFLPTTSKIIIKDLMGVREYFIAIKELYKEFIITKCELLSQETIILNTDIVIVTGIDEFAGKSKNKNDDSFNIRGRQSFILKKENNDWKIIHHHRSNMPK